MKIALIGGHLAPALAVLEKLKGNTDVVFIGRKYGFEGDRAITLEYQTISEMKVPFYELNAGRLQRHFSRHTLPSLLKFPIGITNAISLLKRIRPDVVVSFGGYLSLPIAYATHFLDIPLVIHEQTLEAGFANKVIAPFASAVCISWDSSKKDFPEKNVILTGNPLRRDIQKPLIPGFAKLLDRDLPIVYITGGSSGSHAINALVKGCIGKLLEEMIVVHQTGDAKAFSDFEQLSAMRNNMDERKASRYVLHKFIDPREVGFIYKKADLIVSRSGINTVTELLYLSKPALFIPLPFSARQEQKKNALFLAQLGLAEILPQKQATPDLLFKKITSIIQNKKMYTIKDNGKKYKEGIEEAADSIARIATDIAKEKDFKAGQART